MIASRATLDVPRELAQFTARLLGAERRRRGTPRGSRALTCFWEALRALRWFRDRTSPGTLARDHSISRATAYRYLDEVIDVLAEQAPDLHQALERAKGQGFSQVILDGKIIPTFTPPRLWHDSGDATDPVHVTVAGETYSDHGGSRASAERTGGSDARIW